MQGKGLLAVFRTNKGWKATLHQIVVPLRDQTRFDQTKQDIIEATMPGGVMGEIKYKWSAVNLTSEEVGNFAGFIVLSDFLPESKRTPMGNERQCKL